MIYLHSEGNSGYIGELCGTLTGQHMYLDAGGVEDRQDIGGTTSFDGDFDRRFRYKVSYIECGKTWTPDAGCKQFFMGFSGEVKSYNFDGGHHLNSQIYT